MSNASTDSSNVFIIADIIGNFLTFMPVVAHKNGLNKVQLRIQNSHIQIFHVNSTIGFQDYAIFLTSHILANSERL